MKKSVLLWLFISILLTQWCIFNQNKTPNVAEPEQTINSNGVLENNDMENSKIDNNNNDHNETTYYENKSEKFSINFPKDRKIKESKFDVTISTPKNDDINENVIIVTQQLQKFLSIDEYYEETIQQLQETLEWFKEVKNTNITQWELKGKTIIYEHILKDKNLTLKSLQTFFMAPENRVYSINYTATEDSFDTYIKWVEIITDSFELK